VKMPKRYTDLAPSWAVTLEINRYRAAVAEARTLVERLEDMVAEQAQRERETRRKARRNGR